jgi:hypothetical protein
MGEGCVRLPVYAKVRKDLDCSGQPMTGGYNHFLIQLIIGKAAFL